MSDRVVLLVEDNERNLKLARDVLEYAGFTVLVATTGEEAVDHGAARSPDLILMDLQLPGIDGHAALSLLREDPTTADIPVVALTAFAMARTGTAPWPPGSTAISRSPSASVAFPDQVRTTSDEGER